MSSRPTCRPGPGVDGSVQEVPSHDSTRLPVLEPKVYRPAAQARLRVSAVTPIRKLWPPGLMLG
jgi:hypothetical protein